MDSTDGCVVLDDEISSVGIAADIKLCKPDNYASDNACNNSRVIKMLFADFIHQRGYYNRKHCRNKHNYSDWNDIIADFPEFKKQQKDEKTAVQLDLNEQIVLSAISDEELHYDELLEKTQLDSKTLNSLLTRMEIRGLIIRLAGNFFVKKN